MSWLSEMLKRWNIIAPFSRDEQLNAETEDALRTQKLAAQDAKQEFVLQHAKTEKLRKVMFDARLRVATFAQFEQRIKDMTKRSAGN